MSASKYPIREEFMALPNIPTTENLLLLKLLSLSLSLTRLFFKVNKNIALTKHRIKGADGATVKVVELSPKTLTKTAPTLVYFPGGGFFFSHTRLHLEKAQQYALQAQCRVFLVAYRLSTKTPFPTPFNDCFAGLQWVHENAVSLKVDPTQIVLGGDSAGGCLAAAVAQKACDQNRHGHSLPVVGQMLIYPVIDCQTKTQSAQLFSDTPVWNTAWNKSMWNIYLRNVGFKSSESTTHNLVPKYASPIHRDDFSGLPPAYIEAAEFDPLKDEAIDYALALQNADVPVKTHTVAGAVHGYDFVKGEQTDHYQQERIDALAIFFNT